MKGLKTILGLVLATTGMGGAIAVGAVSLNTQTNNIEMAEAATSGSLIVKFASNHNWFQSNAKICAYLTNDSSSYWTSLQTTSSSKLLYKFDYSIGFTPTKLIWVRMNPSETSGSWDSGKKWNQTGDLPWKEATYINNGWDNPSYSQWTLSAQVRSSLVPSFGTKTTLSTIGLNGDNNPEVSGSVTLEKDEEFKMLAGDGVWSGYYGCPDALNNAFDGGSKTARSDQNPNIVCKIAGTYDFYFDTETKRVWLSRQDIVDADGYASYFLANVGCDATGATSPSGWSTVASAYSGLSNDAKDFLYAATGSIEEGADNIARCVYWYDYAVRVHSELTKFMVNRSGTPRASSNTIVFANNSNNSAIILIVVIASSIAIISTGAFFLLRKKKHN